MNIGVFASVESLQKKFFQFIETSEDISIEGVFYLSKDIDIKKKMVYVFSNSCFSQEGDMPFSSLKELKELYAYEFGKRRGSLKLAKLLCEGGVSSFMVIETQRE